MELVDLPAEMVANLVQNMVIINGLDQAMILHLVCRAQRAGPLSSIPANDSQEQSTSKLFVLYRPRRHRAARDYLSLYRKVMIVYADYLWLSCGNTFSEGGIEKNVLAATTYFDIKALLYWHVQKGTINSEANFDNPPCIAPTRADTGMAYTTLYDKPSSSSCPRIAMQLGGVIVRCLPFLHGPPFQAYTNGQYMSGAGANAALNNLVSRKSSSLDLTFQVRSKTKPRLGDDAVNA
ncbi:uncharacterized protein RSE6_07850 [Rhynchosporium secalis]|uniref:Uncharacterized protein n=1 Tax=Rhynchosporium secalis TaxID=38038 RepID=A0A1E1ME25_RHYSE|nr:uncharacterized protein RSE6_07850 [Rhynchosporium secalis]